MFAFLCAGLGLGALCLLGLEGLAEGDVVLLVARNGGLLYGHYAIGLSGLSLRLRAAMVEPSCPSEGQHQQEGEYFVEHQDILHGTWRLLPRDV